MALMPGDQDGTRVVAAGAIVVPAGCVVNEVECLPTQAGAGATVDVSAFEPSIGGTIPVPVGTAYEEFPKKYVGDGAKSIVFGGDVAVGRVSWTVL